MSIEPPDLARSLPAGEHLACLGLGSNVDPGWHLQRAIAGFARLSRSRPFPRPGSRPRWASDGPDYVNAALLVRTPQSKEGLMVKLKQIEDEFGRLAHPGPGGTGDNRYRHARL